MKRKKKQTQPVVSHPSLLDRLQVLIEEIDREEQTAMRSQHVLLKQKLRDLIRDAKKT